jgi:hypothetical protein
MTRLIDKLTDQDWRHRMGRRFEALADEIFQVIRWVLVGLPITSPAPMTPRS